MSDMPDDVQRVQAGFLESIRSYREMGWGDEALAHDLAAVAVTLARGLVEQARAEQREAIAKAIEDRSFLEVEGRYTLTHPLGNTARVLRLVNNDAAKLARDFGKDGAP